MRKNKLKQFVRRSFSGLMACVVTMPLLGQLSVAAEEPEKYPYTLFGRNGITVNASSNLCINGNVHTNKEGVFTAANWNQNGTITTGADINERIKHVYVDSKVMSTYFTENCTLYEDTYVLSEMNIHVNNPVFARHSIELHGNITLNSYLGTYMDINITGEVENANNAVLYSKFGDITIDTDNVANMNGLVYAPLGTVTIDASNINFNGVLIADEIIVNGSCINMNGNDNLAYFIGNTSEAYDFSGLEYLPEDWLCDTDEDRLFDIFEKVIDSDPLDSDTDDDNLPDGYEVVDLDTDPLRVDTDADTISDADEDFDEDGLTNLDEYLNGTKPYNPDSDDDTLKDGDEVYLYGTNPQTGDTDEDGLNDAEEGTYGLFYAKYGILFDPNNPHTFDPNLLDGEVQFKQQVVQSVDAHDGIITDISVVMEANGNLEQNLSIESVYGVDLMSTDVVGLIGDPFSFETNSNFSSATITFTVNQANLGSTNFSDLIVLWYDEENHKYVECTTENGFKTTRNAYISTVSVETTHFSTYMLVDSKAWYEAWDESYRKISAAAPTTSTGGSTTQVLIDHYNTVFVIDTSGSMSDDPNGEWIGYDSLIRVLRDDAPARPPISDPAMEAYWLEKYGKNTCQRIVACENVIDTMYSNDKAAIITFSYGDSSNTKILSELTSSKTALKDSLQNFTDVGGTCFSYALNRAVDLLKFSGELERTDVINRIVFLSDGEPDNDTQTAIDSAVANAKANGIQIFAFGLGNASGDAVLENMATSTGGDFFKVIEASELPRIVEQAVTTQTDLSQDFASLMDVNSDEDSLPDVVEKFGLMFNGTPIETNIYKEDTDEDGLWDDEEVIFDRETFITGLEIGVCTEGITFFANPTEQHSDTDGIEDERDKSPLANIDSNFIIIDDIENYGIDYLISDAYQENINKANETHGSIECDWNDGLKDELLNYFMSLGGMTPLSTLLMEIDTGFAMGATPNGANALFHYLQNDGNDLYISLSTPLGLVKTQRRQYYNQINSFFDMVEDTVKSGNTYSFSTTTTPDQTWFVDYHEKSADTQQIADDWWLTFGGAYNALTAEVSSYLDVNNQMHYTAKINYYVYDLYDWDGKDEEELANLHKYGKAKSFRIIGSYSIDIDWIEGKRYPTAVNDEYPLNITEFDGIDDNSALKNAYDYGNKYYDDVNGFVYPFE
ncbi:MAG: VWA domain-containing protein [Oscillospiraceae bacterium]|nr:VWA domain-containing protein [Oscillospiraceae bacterium]